MNVDSLPFFRYLNIEELSSNQEVSLSVHRPSEMPNVVDSIVQVRAEYMSARLIFNNLLHRARGAVYRRHPGYVPSEVDYRTPRGASLSDFVRDYDVRFLDRVSPEKASSHLNLILLARNGHADAVSLLKKIEQKLLPNLSERFKSDRLTENPYVIPYTTEGRFSVDVISNKGEMLLDLSRRGFATPDFSLLTAFAYELSPEDRKKCALECIHNLECLSGRKLGDPQNPLLIALRTAMPEYLPGFMPTYLNAGLTPDLQKGLPARYGEEASARIRLNNRKTLLEALSPDEYRRFESGMSPRLSSQDNHSLAARMESVIRRLAPELLDSPLEQIFFFIDHAYSYYDSHFDALRNFMGRDIHRPTIIVQRMVCSVIDDRSYAGVLYSRHPRKGRGVYLQYARTVYGEELMTGRMRPEDVFFQDQSESRHDFPAVYHFWRRVSQLEEIFEGPVMVEFTGVRGTFTILQVNQAELSGAGMLTAVMDLFRNGKIGASRVRSLIKPYHVRQIESDAIDSQSLQNLRPFCTGLSVLPRSAVSGRAFFSSENVEKESKKRGADNIILIKNRFTPRDTIFMQSVKGICSMSPAAIHVVTTAQNLGIPALLNLEENAVVLDEKNRVLRNADGASIHEGDWVTISSRIKTLFLGKAVFVPARLLRFMNGEKVEMTPGEKPIFEGLALCYKDYRAILENVEASRFESLQDLGHAVRYGKLRDDPKKAEEFVNLCFDSNRKTIALRLLGTTLGTHLVNIAAFDLLPLKKQVLLLKDTMRLCEKKGLSGYGAGAFVIGSLVKPGMPCVFWESFSPAEVGRLLNEWILHQKYIHVLSDVGERRIRRAEDYILTHGLGRLAIHTGFVSEFVTLKLSEIDLSAVSKILSPAFDPQTKEMLSVLQLPWGHFFDFDNPWSLSTLKKICEAEDRPLPGPEDV
ncbi:MAG: hypothetical protein ABIJ35_07595 [Acidobacteriota bacterium]